MRASSRSLLIIAAIMLGLAGCSGSDDAAPPEDSDQAQDPSPDEARQFEVFFTNLELGETGEVHPVDRETTQEDVPRAALAELLSGPTASEQEEGYTSWFSSETADLLASMEIEDGVADVDFHATLPEIIPNASTSAGATALLAELDATLTQFAEIDEARYRLGGDVDAFYEWLQLAPPDGAPAGGEDDEAGPDGAVEEVSVEVYFANRELGDDTEAFAVERVVDAPQVLEGALEELLAGPTDAEEAEGYSSWFSEETRGMLESVRIEDRTAHVAFDAGLPETIPGASSSAGSTVLLAALDQTVTQFSTVEEAVYSLDGDVDAFYEWLQRAAPER